VKQPRVELKERQKPVEEREKLLEEKEKPRVMLFGPFVAAPGAFIFPFGALSIASVLTKAREGKLAEVLVVNPNEHSQRELVNLAREYNPHHVGFTVWENEGYYQLPKLVRELKKTLPKTNFVIGGPALKHQAKAFFEHSGADAAISGEAETAFKNFVKLVGTKHLSEVKREELEKIPGLWFKDAFGKTVSPKKQADVSVEELNAIDLDWRLMKNIVREADWLPFYSSRGCPKSCVFCEIVHGKQFRPMTPEKIVQELEKIGREYPRVKWVCFTDDNFAFDRQRILSLSKLIQEKGLNKRFVFNIQVTIDSLLRKGSPDLELIDALKKMNTFIIGFGTESFSDDELKRLAKTGYDAKAIMQLTSVLAEKGIWTNHSLILSNRETKPRDLALTLSSVIQLIAKHKEKILTNPIPFVIPTFNTPVYAWLKKKNLLHEAEGINEEGFPTRLSLMEGEGKPVVAYRVLPKDEIVRRVIEHSLVEYVPSPFEGELKSNLELYVILYRNLAKEVGSEFVKLKEKEKVVGLTENEKQRLHELIETLNILKRLA